jgi:hypothetical protein
MAMERRKISLRAGLLGTATSPLYSLGTGSLEIWPPRLPVDARPLEIERIHLLFVVIFWVFKDKNPASFSGAGYFALVERERSKKL